MKQEELNEILNLHKKWLNSEVGGKRANLKGADLEGANLYGADLNGADLEGANLRGANKIPLYCKWSIGITDGQIHIGCKKMSIEDWDKFFASDEVFETERNTDEFKQIEACYNAYKAYLLTLKVRKNEN